MPSQSETSGQKANRVTTACRNCRSRKVRCSGGSPCKDCTRLGKECIYLPLQRRRRTKESYVSEAIEDRLARMEARLEDTIASDIRETVQSPSFGQTNTAWQSPTFLRPNLDVGLDHEIISTTRSTRAPSISGRSTNSQELESRGRQGVSPSLRVRSAHDPGRSRLGSNNDAITGNIGDTALPECKSEHHEPWSWMSICSQTGLDWVCKRTRNRDFINIADRFANSLARSMTTEESVSLDTKSFEVDETTARQLVDAFFEDCWEASIGIVHRPDVESWLQTYFSDKASKKDDPAWFALRNTIFAGGYRSILARSLTTSFAVAQSKAWSYFNNALSVLTKLLIPPSSLMAIQALTLMACYTECLGHPALQHLLCSNAVHLAQTKGLHRQPENSWGVSADNTLKRNWLWWTIYALEKHLALSSGRPSAIDDGNVTAQIPSVIPHGSNIELDSLVVAYRHAQICGQISRKILSVKAIQMSTTQLIDIVNDLQRQLTQLLQEMPAHIKIGALARPTRELLSTPQFIHSLYLHFAIYGSMMAVHTHFFYPWMSSRLAIVGQDNILESQISLSSATVAEAARKIILALRLVTNNVTTPSWLALYYPVYAHINLFIHILKYPTLPSTQADLGLLDVCVGHFGYLEFMTASEISISFPRDSATLASKVAKAAKLEEHQNAARGTSSQQMEINAPEIQNQGNLILAEDDLVDSTSLSEVGNLLAFDSAAWNVFSSFDMMNTNAPIYETFDTEAAFSV